MSGTGEPGSRSSTETASAGTPRQLIHSAGHPDGHPAGQSAGQPAVPNHATGQAEDGGSKAKDGEAQRLTVLQKIGRLSGAEKIQLALKGTQEERFVLIRDSNKSVSRAVLESPRITEHEVEAYASLRDVDEEVLRSIGQSRHFLKEYAVAVALVSNPRAPIDVTLPLMVRLKERELKALALNRNVPSALRSTALKILGKRQKGH